MVPLKPLLFFFFGTQYNCLAFSSSVNIKKLNYFFIILKINKLTK